MDPSFPFPPAATTDADPISTAVAADATVLTASALPAVEPLAAHAATANPTPPAQGATAVNHPPYADMICAAIAALKERNGSSRRAIAKYIEQAYSGLPPNHSALLTRHLKRLKANGLLVMVKKSYKLPNPRSDNNGTIINTSGHVVSSAPPAAGAASAPGSTKRGRGRPPKSKPDSTQPILAQPADASQPNLANPIATPQPDAGAQPVFVALGLVDESTTKRAPGRPRKSVPMAVVQGGVGVGVGLDKRRPGRPPKPKSGGPVGGGDIGGPGLAKRRPGRPPGRKPKSIAGGINGPKIKRRPGRPPKAQSVPLVVPYSSVVDVQVQRPRGRPKVVDATSAAAAAAFVNGGVKRRGRPAKVSGEVKLKKRTGKSPGRPKKTVTWAVTEAAGPQMEAANGDLKKKLEYFQSKVKQVVGVLKPQLTTDSTISAVTAIQELEGLATLDIAAPLQEEVQVQVQAQQPMLQN